MKWDGRYRIGVASIQYRRKPYNAAGESEKSGQSGDLGNSDAREGGKLGKSGKRESS